mmetsp:Transcript_73980/g.176074  ORF Transcript_73980/g.176074 Transcript_73980/m.176074 type:complete len:231 (-) Transcript_73980:13-705(-)
MASAVSSGAQPSDDRPPARKSPLPQKSRGFKLVLLGDAAVGKSSILMRFLQNKFSEGIETTVGAAFSTKTIEGKEGKEVKFEIWDTAGQERFRSLAPMYYRGASAAVVVYDQTNAVTFDRAQEWVRQVMTTSTNPKIVIALAANKMDMPEQRAVPMEAADAFAKKEGLIFLETSAKSGKNVAKLFEDIALRLPDEPFVPEQPGIVVKPTLASATTNPTSTVEQRRGCCQG